MKKKKRVNTALIVVAAVILVIVIVANVLLASNSDTISSYLGGSSSEETDDGEYTADEVFSENRALNETLGEESTVLLKNENNTLPLAQGTKVTFFGTMSYNYIISGNGSGAGKDDDNTLMMNTAFKNAGLDVNDAAWSALETAVGGSRGATPQYSIGGDYNSTNSWSSYVAGTEFAKTTYETIMTDAVLSDYTGGYAVITIGRNGAEGASPSFDVTGSGDYFTQTYLELTAEEKDLLEFVAAKFSHVILLVNSAAPMELGFIDMVEYKIDAALWIGYPGENGIQGVANCITNKNGANPSGRLADIWAYDLTTTPSYYNSGYNEYTNYNAVGTQEAGLAAGYFDYEEGIYIGYRYYETADELGYFASNQFTQHKFKGNIKDTDGVYNSDYTDSTVYDSSVYSGAYGRVVQYAFGYGLSYTTFTQEIANESVKLTAHGSNSITVKVTNTGNYAGKTAVQLYMNAPKQQDSSLGIKNYGLEKATRTLVAFAKTDTIQPGESENVVLEFATDDLASYDYTGCCAYVLEKGDYAFEVCDDSHTVLDTSKTVSVSSSIVYNENGVGKRDSDEVVATNQMDDISAGEGLLDAGPGGYMSRYDGTNSGFEYAWEHIWDKTPYRATEALPEAALAVASTGPLESTNYTYTAYKNGSTYQKTETYYMKGATQQAYMTVTPDGLSMDDASYAVTWGSEATNYTVNSRFDKSSHEYVCEAEELGLDEYAEYDTSNTVGFADLDYDDPLWEQLLDQVTLEEAINVQGCSGWGIPAVESIGKPYVQWIDGPGESGNGSYANAVCWVCEVNLSATFNEDLIEEMGIGYGRESQLHGTGGAYAPAMNAHRSPFEGRFFEYYCEDPLVAGKIGAAEVRGIQSTGTGVTIKHYALNDDCSSSPGAFTWVSEQAGRELYYKPYELCIKEADARGIMTSVIRVGFSSSSHYGMYVNMTRKEWGFKGYAITDGFTQAAGDFITANSVLFGGQIGCLSRNSRVDASGIPETEGTGAYETNYGQYLLREIVHNMLWQYVGTSGIEGSQATWWKTIWIVGDVVLGLAFVGCVTGAVVQYVRTGKKREDDV